MDGAPPESGPARLSGGPSPRCPERRRDLRSTTRGDSRDLAPSAPRGGSPCRARREEEIAGKHRNPDDMPEHTAPRPDLDIRQERSEALARQLIVHEPLAVAARPQHEPPRDTRLGPAADRKSTRLNSSHSS